MGNQHNHREIKEATIRLYEADALPLAAILEYTGMGISRATFYRMYAIWLETGDVVRPVNGRRGRPRILHFSDVDYLKRLIQHRPN